MRNSQLHIRPATAADAGAVAQLAADLAQSFPFSPAAFNRAYPAVLAAEDACLLLAEDLGGAGREASRAEPLGYLLGFWHPAFFANGPVAWVEEILVRPEYRGRGAGRALMSAFEQHARTRAAVWSRWPPGGRPRSIALWATRNRPSTSARC